MDQQEKHSEDERTEQQAADDAFVKEHTSEIPVVSTVDGRRPAPFVPDFAWRPGFNDFPVALVTTSSTIRRRARADGSGWEDWPTLETVGHHRTPARYIPHALAVAAIIAVIMSNGFWLNRSDDPSDEPQEPAVGVVDNTPDAAPTPEGESLLGRNQQPGQGGEPEDSTPTADTEADEEEDVSDLDETPVRDTTATAGETPTAGGGIMIPDPSAPSATTTVEVPDAGAITYTADRGQTLLDISDQFGISVPTLLWANDVSDPAEELPSGTEVVVPPLDGVLHTVASGDTISKIADRYGVTTDVILDFTPNGIGGSPDLRVGQLVMVPGGKILDWGEIQAYTVREGDNLWRIASYYGLDAQTLVWANELPRPELISPGQTLKIPPGDGALIEVQSGDNVEAIAQRFGVEASAIRDYGFNKLGNGRVLQVGQMLLVPGAPLPELEGPSELDADSVAGEGAFNPATGSFLWPTNGFISQEFHASHNGVDIANEEWTPVNAADGGIVIFAGWNDYGLGYAVGVDHGNGYQTLYGHLANTPYVEVGQVVWQGGYLGPMGSTGKSTGPHLHFVLMKDGAYQNPLNYLE